MHQVVLKLVELSLRRPRLVIALSLGISLALASQLPRMRIDTDPENMLRQEEPVRVFHRQVKETFGIKELLVLGIVRQDGIFKPDTLERITRITAEVKRLPGVVGRDVESLSSTNNVVAREGVLHVRPPLLQAPQGQEGLQRLRAEVLENPLFRDRLVSSHGQAAAIYIPILQKDMAHEVAQQVAQICRRILGPEEEFYLAGLPLAEDTFGSEMFKQMAVVAPLAGAFLMALMYLIFRSLLPVVASMAVAMLAVLCSMGAMVALGFEVHIMSSMIPVFLMPIAVCDAVHVLSDLRQRLGPGRDRREVLQKLYRALAKPMLYTSLTTAVGFSMLAWAKIPPVRVFGLFVALGVVVAWLLSMSLLPAMLSLWARPARLPQQEGSPLLGRLGRLCLRGAKPLVALLALGILFSLWGIKALRVNDNPVKWFKPHHPVRVADGVLNRLMGGTYISYLVIEGSETGAMKEPQVLAYLQALQEHLQLHPLVGKTTSVVDVLKRINYVLHDQEEAFNRLPEDRRTVGQYLFLYLMSSAPDELEEFLDYPQQRANVWVQLRSGDNRDMQAVVSHLEAFLKDNPPPAGIKAPQWSGLPYLNITWQALMVKGMLQATVGSWWAILLLLIAQFRSFWWGLLSMLPLALAVLFSYAMVGYAGKDYDMPIAVCSTLALGLGVDFAIHFVHRFRDRFSRERALEPTLSWSMGGEPALAIFRNALVVGLGFLPLMLSTLTPYVTVGLFFGSITFSAGLATLLFLPALVVAGRKVLLKEEPR
jgi:hypothetical protein